MKNLTIVTKLTPIKNEKFEIYKWEETPLLINLDLVVSASKIEEIGHVVVNMVGGAQIIVDSTLEELLS